ncbi:MAG: ribosome maturation factor RimP [Coxiellaceae bacterium]|nr:ribosome maturation factor RimP [Coxiellaceae bacterium]
MASVRQLEAIFTPSVEALGCHIWHCELQTAGKRKILRLLIEGENGVNANVCAKISRQVSSILDVENLVSGQYMLEVSSPGMDRPLVKPEHFQQYVGRKVKLKLRMPQQERRQWTGELQQCDDEQIHLVTDEGELDVRLDNIDKANLVPDF